MVTMQRRRKKALRDSGHEQLPTWAADAPPPVQSAASVKRPPIRHHHRDLRSVRTVLSRTPRRALATRRMQTQDRTATLVHLVGSLARSDVAERERPRLQLSEERLTMTAAGLAISRISHITSAQAARSHLEQPPVLVVIDRCHAAQDHVAMAAEPLHRAALALPPQQKAAVREITAVRLLQRQASRANSAHGLDRGGHFLHGSCARREVHTGGF